MCNLHNELFPGESNVEGNEWLLIALHRGLFACELAAANSHAGTVTLDEGWLPPWDEC